MPKIHTSVFAISILVLAGCGTADNVEDAAQSAEVDVSGDAPAVSYTPKGDPESFIGKPKGPVTIAYRVIGEPVVGQPVTIDLRLASNMGAAPVQLDVRIPDSTALEMPQDQPASVSLAAPGDETPFGHQLTVVPQREGRLYLNVSASMDTPDGTMSTVTAIPLQVGEGGRVLQENGTLQTTPEGDLIRSLPAN